MFSMCSELTPHAPISYSRIAQFMQPWSSLWFSFRSDMTDIFLGSVKVVEAIIGLQLPSEGWYLLLHD